MRVFDKDGDKHTVMFITIYLCAKQHAKERKKSVLCDVTKK